MDIAFRVSLAISVIIHSAVIVAMNDLKVQERRDDNKKPVVVDYIKQEKIPEKIRQEPTRGKPLAETPQISIPKKISIAVQDKDLSAPAAKEKPAKSAISDDAVKQAKLTSSKDYISYNHLIRQKILVNLKRRYNERYEEGDVAVTFT